MDADQLPVTDAALAVDVQAPEATAAPDNAANTPVDQQNRTFSQEEVDALITKRLAKEQRKWERKLTQPAQQQRPVSAPAPTADQFANVDEYAQALAERKAQELVQQRDQRQQQEALLENYQEREEAAREKYDDFEQVALNPKLPITTLMAQTIQASDVGPDVAYYLGSNPKEAERISRLPAYLQAKEIGRIEAKVQSSPPAKKTTAAPSPIKPVTARSASTTYDTTDPRSVKNMTTSEWIEAERARQMRNAESRGVR
jgi:hypothetical protein